MIDFYIERWRAWAPGIDTDEAWQQWANAPWSPNDQNEQPACAFVPAMQRRRLSRLARITLDTAWPLCGDDEQLPFVFASRHGETTRTFALLSEIAAEQPLSPTQFGLSVHNAIAGQWSILRGQRGESAAIAGEADTFEHAMLEAAALLSNEVSTVLVVIAEEFPPRPYQAWIDDVPFSYAVALRVKRYRGDEAIPPGTGWRLSLASNTSSETSHGEWPHALAFLRALHQQTDVLEQPCKARRWIWQAVR